MGDDLFYLLLLVVGAWTVITSLWALDALLCKYWPAHRWHSARGKRMEDERHELWIRQFLIEFDKRKGKRQRISDMKSSYVDRLKSLFADYVVEVMTERKDWSASEINKELDRLGNLFDLPDLLPLSQRMLAENIKRRLANKEAYKPVNLPDPVTASQGKVNKAKIKPNPFTHSRKLHQWHTSLRSWLRTKAWRRQMPT